MYSLYTVLGLDENACDEAVNAAYSHLRHQLAALQLEPCSLGGAQAAQCLAAVEQSYQTLSNPERLSEYQHAWKLWLNDVEATEMQPKLGQLCVAAGIITLDDLNNAIESQTKLDLPIGQIMQENLLITQAELDGLLLGQQLITLPVDLPHRIGQRLIALGLVTEDMVRIALIEQRTFDKELAELLIGHGWLDPDVFNILKRPLQLQ